MALSPGAARVMFEELAEFGRATGLEDAGRRGPQLTDAEFAERYLRRSTMFPEAGPAQWHEPAPVHHELSEHATSDTFLILEISRDFAKSTWATIWLLRRITEDRNVRTLLISKTLDAAIALARPIRLQLEGNETLIADYGEFRGPKWTDQEFTVRRTVQFKEPTVRCVGRGGQIVSGRYDIVVFDDVEDWESTRTDERLAGTQNWATRDVLPTVTAQGQVFVIETPQTEGDLPGTLATNPIWTVVNRPAEEPVEAPPDPARPWLTRRSNWPAKWPVYWNPQCDVAQAEREGGQQVETKMARAAAVACKQCPVFNRALGDTGGRSCLTGKRFQIGPVPYRLQYLCDRRALAGDVFREEWFQVYSLDEQGVHWRDGRWWFRHLPLELAFGIDPAVADEGEKNPEQYSRFALVVLGYHRTTRIHCLLHYVNARVDWPTQLEMLQNEVVQWWPRVVGVEEVAFQRALRQEIKRAIATLRQGAPHLPEVVVRGIPNILDKRLKFTSLTPEVQQGLFWVGPRHEEFVLQAVRFPRGAHTDLLDGYYYAKKIALGVEPMFADAGDMQRAAEETARALREHPHVIPPPQLGTPKPGEWTRDELLGLR